MRQRLNQEKYLQDREGGVASEDQETLYDNEIVTLLEGHHRGVDETVK